MNILFLVALILMTLVGFEFLFIPSLTLVQLGVTLDAASTVVGRLFGAAMFSFAILIWFARKSGQPEFKKGVVYTLFTYFLLSTILFLMNQLAGFMNLLGWSLVALHALFAVWFGYFIVKKYC